MLKFAYQDKDKTVIGLGLSEKNLELLKEDKPIAFPATEVMIKDNRKILILYQPPDTKLNPEMAKALSETCVFVLSINDDTMSDLRAGNMFTLDVPGVTFKVLCGDEIELEGMFRKHGLIGPETVVTRTGFAPSDLPPSSN